MPRTIEWSRYRPCEIAGGVSPASRARDILIVRNPGPRASRLPWANLFRPLRGLTRPHARDSNLPAFRPFWVRLDLLIGSCPALPSERHQIVTKPSPNFHD